MLDVQVAAPIRTWIAAGRLQAKSVAMTSPRLIAHPINELSLADKKRDNEPDGRPARYRQYDEENQSSANRHFGNPHCHYRKQAT